MSGMTMAADSGGWRQLLAARHAWKANLGPDVQMIEMKRSFGGSVELLKSILKSLSAPLCPCSALEAVLPMMGTGFITSCGPGFPNDHPTRV